MASATHIPRHPGHSSHMLPHHNTSAQQRRAACSPQRRRRMPALPLSFPNGGYEALGDVGRVLWTGSTQPVSETKLLIIAVMGELGRPMSAPELYKIWDGAKPLQVFKYHLCTLVEAKVVELVIGPELQFQLVPVTRDTGSLQGAMPSALTESKRTEP